MRVLVLPKEAYPNNRVWLSHLFEKEFTNLGHELIWVMYSNIFSDDLKIISKQNNTFYIIKKKEERNLIDALKNKFLFIEKYFLCKKLILDYKIDIIQTTDGILEGFIGVFLSKKFKIPSAFFLSVFFYEVSKANWHTQKDFKTMIKYLVALISKPLYLYIIKNVTQFQPVNKWAGKYFKSKGFNLNFFPLPMSGLDNFLNSNE